MRDDTPRPWRRLFGITLTDLFAGTPWRVEQEPALRSQLLDVVIIAWPTGDPGRSACSERKRSTSPPDDNRFAPQGRLRLTAAGAAITG